ncbi:hypothetical protein QJQ45_006715 [Haematococcus lacustris]|nr:hypothetical protein QJQ45_006715 [Haematococcus lacustris]
MHDGVCQQLGLTRETEEVFTTEPARSQYWDRWFSTGKLVNQGTKRTVETAGVSVCVHYTRTLPPPPAPPLAAGPSNSNNLLAAAPDAAAAAAHVLGLTRIGKALAEFVFDPATQIGVGIDPSGTRHPTVTLATWDAVWEVYLDPKWARKRLRLYGAQDRALEQFFNKLEKDMAVSMERHGCAKQLVVFFGAASIGTAGGWGADAVLRACCKVVCRPRGPDQRRGRVVLVDEHRTSRVSSAVDGQQPWPNVVPGSGPPQAPCSSQEATQAAASEPGPSTPLPAKRSKRSKRTETEQAAEPTQPTKGKAKGKAAKVKPAPQPRRWLDRDCNAASNMQRIGTREHCQPNGKEYPGLGYKRLRDKPPKAQQQQPAEAQ